MDYHAEPAKRPPDHAAASGQIRHFLRSHVRTITIAGCAHGYAATHRGAPQDGHADDREAPSWWSAMIGTEPWETLYGQGLPPYSDFDETGASLVREVRSGEYADPPDYEARDYVSNDKVLRRTAEAARKEAAEVLREFFEQNPPRDPW